MKKLLSVFMALVMLLGTVAVGVTAASDTCIRLSDTNGATGYSAGSDSINEYVIEQDGATLIFDVFIESYSVPTSGSLSEIFVFTGDSDYNYAGYNFNAGAFTAGASEDWVTGINSGNYNCLASRDYDLKIGTWYEIAYQFNGNEVTVYLDGIPMVSAELDQVEHKYLILYPRYCTILVDNLRVCGKDYNVRDRVGDVVAVDDFTGDTSVTSTSIWDFSGTGYTVSQNGRPMTELGDMVPNRIVAPEISGAYLQYKESGGNGVSVSMNDFTAYNGFTVVEDIRVDRKSAGANFAVRFGSNYIAGYDWDNQCFRISQRAGYGFNTAAVSTYAKTDYALVLGTTYEFAVRQNGSLVSVYLNGVLVAQASNNGFAAGFNDVQLSHYRLGASIDNLIVAYSDYDVKEATGGTVAKFSFEESASYINSIWNFNIGTSGYGYTLMSSASSAKAVVDSVEAVDGVASVGISLAGCPQYDSFVMSVSYPNGLSLSKATVAEIDGAVSYLSPTTQKPLKLTCVTDGAPITNADVLDLTFAVPATAGSYKIDVTVTPYINGAEAATLTGSGTITVPETEIAIQTGLPTGIEYDGEYIYWDYLDGATIYEIYTILPDDDEYEEFIIDTEECECEFVFTDYFTDPGLYKIKIYAYNEDYEIFAVSDPYIVVYGEDENLSFGLSGYAEHLYNELSELVASKKYSAADQSMAEDLLAEAEDEMSYAVEDEDYNALVEVYNFYYEEISAIPEQEEIVITNGKPDGIKYSGSVLSWNAFSGATKYKIYAVNSNGSESLIKSATTNSCALIFGDHFTGAGEYQFKIYAYNASESIIAVSSTCTVILDENGTAYLELSAYADVLYQRLVDLVSTRLYSEDNQEAVNTYLKSARADLAATTDYDALMASYNDYYTTLDAIPEATFIPGDTNNDGALSSLDVTYLRRVLTGAMVVIYPGCDVDGDGSLTGLDLTVLQRLISG